MNPDMGGGKKQIEHGVQVYNTLTGAKKKKKKGELVFITQVSLSSSK